MSLANSSGWPWREKKIEQQNWRMMDLPNCSGWPWRRTMKEIKTGEDGIYHIAQVDTTQLRLALETEEERRA